jgi:hypothetical protein
MMNNRERREAVALEADRWDNPKFWRARERDMRMPFRRAQIASKTLDVQTLVLTAWYFVKPPVRI